MLFVYADSFLLACNTEYGQNTATDEQNGKPQSKVTVIAGLRAFCPIAGICRNDSILTQMVCFKHYYDLQFSPAVETIVKKDKKNPKRVLRDVKKQLQNNGIGTKSQQALKLQHELKKEEYKSNSKHKKQMDAEQKFKLKQQKKKAKHRGH